MARPPQPRWFASRDAWYCQVAGKQVLLARGKERKADAWKAFRDLMADGTPAPAASGPDVRTLCDLFLDRVKAERKRRTYDWYLRHLDSFARARGAMLAADVRPHHVAAWVDGQPWGPSNKAGAIRAVKAAFSWARTMGHLAADPIRELPRRAQRRREAILSPESARAVLDATAGTPLGDLLGFLAETGCRPGEAAALSAADLDTARGLAVLRDHKTAGATGRPRVIVLTAAALELARRLARGHPDGALFRNGRGKPWTRNATACAFRRLRARLGLGREATAQAFRHRFATDLARRQPNTVVAALLGHTSTAMVDRCYSHVLDEMPGPGLETLREAIEGKRHEG